MRENLKGKMGLPEIDEEDSAKPRLLSGKKAKVGRLLASAPAGVVGVPRSTLTKETKRFGFV